MLPSGRTLRARRFEGDECRFLIVASKLQTGTEEKYEVWSMNDEVGHLVRPFFILHPSSFILQPCSWRLIWRRFPRRRDVSEAPTLRTMPAQGNALGLN